MLKILKNILCRCEFVTKKRRLRGLCTRRTIPLLFIFTVFGLKIFLVRQLYTNSASSCDMTEAKNNELRILIKTVTIALERHNVTYWLDYGTALGAYRLCDVIPWDHDADIGYLVTDYKKVVQAADSVNQVIGFKMNSLIARYKNHTLDLFRWEKVKNWWSFSSVYNYISGKNDTVDNFMMYVIMPMDNSVLIYIRNFFMEYFPAKFLEKRSRVKFADFEAYTTRNITEFVKWRYFLSYDKMIPYTIDCFNSLSSQNDIVQVKRSCPYVVKEKINVRL